MAKIKIKGMKITDTMNKIHSINDDEFTCCNRNMKRVCHADGVDFYADIYECECGNTIRVEVKWSRDGIW